MRLKILLTALNGKLPVNYNYPLASTIYNLLRFGSKEFSEFLHDIGFTLDSKRFKLFTFAIMLNQFRIEKDIFILDDPDLKLLVSSPLVDEFINNFIIGTFEKQEIYIYKNSVNYKFRINQIESLPDPEFTETMKFGLLSPLVLSTVVDTSEGMKAHYLRYDDEPDEINRILKQNLQNKYSVLASVLGNKTNFPPGKTNMSPIPGGLKLEWDDQYIQRRLKAGKRISAKVTIDRFNTKIDVIGIRAPFTIAGNRELIKTGYQCGFGEKNSMGFGMAEVW